MDKWHPSMIPAMIPAIMIVAILAACEPKSKSERGRPPFERRSADSAMTAPKPSAAPEAKAASEPAKPLRARFKFPFMQKDGPAYPLNQKNRLIQKGWIVAAEKPEIKVRVNGKDYGVKLVERAGLKEQFPDHPFRSGLLISIPGSALQSENKGEFFLNGKSFKKFTFKISK